MFTTAAQVVESQTNSHTWHFISEMMPVSSSLLSWSSWNFWTQSSICSRWESVSESGSMTPSSVSHAFSFITMETNLSSFLLLLARDEEGKSPHTSVKRVTRTCTQASVVHVWVEPLDFNIIPLSRWPTHCVQCRHPCSRTGQQSKLTDWGEPGAWWIGARGRHACLFVGEKKVVGPVLTAPLALQCGDTIGACSE